MFLFKHTFLKIYIMGKRCPKRQTMKIQCMALNVRMIYYVHLTDVPKSPQPCDNYMTTNTYVSVYNVLWCCKML